MNGRISSVLLTLVALLIAMGLIGTGLDGFSEKPANSIAVIVLGLIMLFGAFVFFRMLVLPAWQDKNSTLREDVRGLVQADQSGAGDADDTDRLIASFRASLRDFFSAEGLPENSPLQSTATQLYWHVLYLQKRRMERLGVRMDFTAERRRYGGVSVSKQKYFDGKYSITDACERIAAKRVYSRAGKEVYRQQDDEMAHYSILNARQGSDGEAIICPSCGSATTRENLLDGCDYCGTKFAVEDLGPRVSSFALRQNYRIAYDKYKDARSYYGRRAFLAGALPVFALSLVAAVLTAGEIEAGLLLKIAAGMFTALFLAAAAGYFAWLFFWISIFPIIQAKRSLTYYNKKKLAARQAAEARDQEVLRQIRSFDRLFSLEHFYSGVQNKLAAIHYAERAKEAGAFALVPLDRLLESYRDVADMDVEEICLLDYRADEALQHVELAARVGLIRARGHRFVRDTETLFLSLEKSAACKTEAVCGPSVLRCAGCGASISLLEGGKCAYCDRQLDLRGRDWVISGYQIS